jgi:nucleotide-binding universal stress UspA family protein
MKLQHTQEIERFLKSAFAREVAVRGPLASASARDPRQCEQNGPAMGGPLAAREMQAAGPEPPQRSFGQPRKPIMKTNIPENVEATVPEMATAGRKAPALLPGEIRLNEVLVPLDMSDMCFKALAYAVSFAEQYGARLTLLHVMEPITIATELATAAPPTPEEIAAMEKELREIRERRIPQDVAVDIVVRHDFAADGILEAAREYEPDLIIIATHGRTGLRHLIMGSTAEKVIRTASCPVLVVRENERDFV